MFAPEYNPLTKRQLKARLKKANIKKMFVEYFKKGLQQFIVEHMKSSKWKRRRFKRFSFLRKKKFKMPRIRKMFPKFPTIDMCSVQPMTEPSEIFVYAPYIPVVKLRHYDEKTWGTTPKEK